MKNRGFKIIVILLVVFVLIAGVVWVMDSRTAVSPTTSTVTTEQQQAADTAVAWLVSNHQNDDGGFSDFSTGANQAPSGASGTLDAILAMAAAANDSSDPITYLQKNTAVIADYASLGGGPAGKTILALTAAGQDPSDFMGHDFVISLTSQISPTGQYNATTAYDQSLALLALAAVDEDVPDTAVQWLKDQQADNGSWNDGFGTDNNVDATGMAVMALIAQDEPLTGPELSNATTFLADAQLDSGGWEYGTGFGENVNSTALAVQALSALGEEHSSALAALLAWQSETGAFQSDFGSGRFDDFFATTQAITAVMGKSYP